MNQSRESLAMTFAGLWINRLEKSAKVSVEHNAIYAEKLSDRAVDLGIRMADRMLAKMAKAPAPSVIEPAKK